MHMHRSLLVSAAPAGDVSYLGRIYFRPAIMHDRSAGPSQVMMVVGRQCNKLGGHQRRSVPSLSPAAVGPSDPCCMHMPQFLLGACYFGCLIITYSLPT